MRGKVTPTVEQRLAQLASRSHGVVTRAQLLTAGLSARQIDERLKKGALIRMHRGVYRVGHRAPSLEARYMAAVKASGQGGVLSGMAAAFLWGLVKGTAPPPEVTARVKRRVKGVRARRNRLEEADKTRWRGIPVTTVPRTVVDLGCGPGFTLELLHRLGFRKLYGIDARLSPQAGLGLADRRADVAFGVLDEQRGLDPVGVGHR